MPVRVTCRNGCLIASQPYGDKPLHGIVVRRSSRVTSVRKTIFFLYAYVGRSSWAWRPLSIKEARTLQLQGLSQLAGASLDGCISLCDSDEEQAQLLKAIYLRLDGQPMWVQQPMVAAA